MLILACVLLGVVVVPLTGGDLRLLAGLRWRTPWLVVTALLTQVVVLQVPGLPEPLAATAHVATYVLAAWFVWLNRRVRGLGVLALGAACNGVTIVLNRGTLPSTAAARQLAGLDEVHGFTNSGVVADPVLGILGDTFAVPQWLPLANVFSVGDLLIVVGALAVLRSVTRRPHQTQGPGPRHARAMVRPRGQARGRRPGAGRPAPAPHGPSVRSADAGGCRGERALIGQQTPQRAHRDDEALV